jgi:hypothetical protein
MLLSVFGSGVLFWLKTYEAKKQMLLYLRNYALEKAILLQLDEGGSPTNPNLQWEGNDEFEWNGKLYDVVTTERKGHKQLIYCVADETETSLQLQMAAQQKSNSSKQVNAMKLFPVFCPMLSTTLVEIINSNNLQHKGFYNRPIAYVAKPIDGPPPKNLQQFTA